MDQLVGTADQLQVVDMDKLWKENKDYKVNGHFFGPSLPKMKGANSQSYRKSKRKCLSPHFLLKVLIIITSTFNKRNNYL